MRYKAVKTFGFPGIDNINTKVIAVAATINLFDFFMTLGLLFVFWVKCSKGCSWLSIILCFDFVEVLVMMGEMG